MGTGLIELIQQCLACLKASCDKAPASTSKSFAKQLQVTSHLQLPTHTAQPFPLHQMETVPSHHTNDNTVPSFPPPPITSYLTSYCHFRIDILHENTFKYWTAHSCQKADPC